MDLEIILYAWISGFTVFIGGVLSYFFQRYFPSGKEKNEIIHFLMAFGGGIILSALALVLVPKGLEELDLIPLLISFSAGAVIFMLLTEYLSKKGGQVAMLMAMLMDYIPESIALGALFTTNKQSATLLAIFIGLQNLPEAFNSFIELNKNGIKARKLLFIFFLLGFSGIIGATSGLYFLSDLPQVTAHIMIFSSGGIIYLLFQDIAPGSHMKRSWLPALGATLGFAVGMIGEKLI